MKHVSFKPFLFLILLTVLLISSGPLPDALAGSRGDSDGDGKAATLRVGVFESRAVALAYGRSELNMSRVRDLKAKHRKAEGEGDDETILECTTLGPRWQDLLHRQVFGDAPIPDILAILETRLPELLETADIDLIVTGIVTAKDGVEVVDVTTDIMNLLGVDEATLKMAGEIKDHPPVPWYEFPLEDE